MPRKHQGINQTTGKLKKGYKYGKKLKSGLRQVVKVSKKTKSKPARRRQIGSGEKIDSGGIPPTADQLQFIRVHNAKLSDDFNNTKDKIKKSQENLKKLIKNGKNADFNVFLKKLKPDNEEDRKKIVEIVDENDKKGYRAPRNYEKIRPEIIKLLKYGINKLSIEFVMFQFLSQKDGLYEDFMQLSESREKVLEDLKKIQPNKQK